MRIDSHVIVTESKGREIDREGGCGLCESINEEAGGEKKDNEGGFTGNKKRKEYI